MKEYTVKEVASLLNKHEETIKRWIRSGKLPNSYRNSDKEGWRIVKADLLNLNAFPHFIKTDSPENNVERNLEEIELIKLSFQAVTLTSPSEDILSRLSIVGIKRTLEILLIMQQSSTKVKNHEGFIRKAIQENWSPATIPNRLQKNVNKKIYELTQREHDEIISSSVNKKNKVPFYNWLEE